ncbi:MAG: DUF3883 domain-containing protein [Planctomycetia bacterium]|nr:DUF3883 domain-containing protein [Planctomycetia bacterium]
MVSAAKDLDGYTLEPRPHGNITRDVTYVFGVGFPPFAFTPAQKFLRFYLRNPRKTHPDLTTKQLEKNFRNVTRAKEGYLSFRIFDVDDAKRAMELAFGVAPPASSPTEAKGKALEARNRPAVKSAGERRELLHGDELAAQILAYMACDKGSQAGGTLYTTRDIVVGLGRVPGAKEGDPVLTQLHKMADEHPARVIRHPKGSNDYSGYSWQLPGGGKSARSSEDRKEAAAQSLNGLQAGAGFGSAAENKLVEDAAIRAVTEHYEAKGWDVHSVERDKCGFDLDCRKGRAVKSVEVKGVRGVVQCFVITAREVKQAETNPNFVLMVVTSALSECPVLTRYTGPEFCRSFELSGVQFRAILRKPKSGNASRTAK